MGGDRRPVAGCALAARAESASSDASRPLSPRLSTNAPVSAGPSRTSCSSVPRALGRSTSIVMAAIRSSSQRSRGPTPARSRRRRSASAAGASRSAPAGRRIRHRDSIREPCHNEPPCQPIRTINVTRYVTPLREGGSLPAIVEADDEGLYVLKFRGAGQGARALVAELVAGEIARALGLAVPEIVLADLDPDLARTEPDPEIHALIHDSAGLNLALDFLPGAVTFDPVVQRPAADLASRIVWFDGLRHQRRPYGAKHQHADVAPAAVADRSRRHVVLSSFARLGVSGRSRAWAVPGDQGSRSAAAREQATRGGRDAGGSPDGGRSRRDPRGGSGSWLTSDDAALAPSDVRAAYRDYLIDRLAAPRSFVEEALGAR